MFVPGTFLKPSWLFLYLIINGSLSASSCHRSSCWFKLFPCPPLLLVTQGLILKNWTCELLKADQPSKSLLAHQYWIVGVTTSQGVLGGQWFSIPIPVTLCPCEVQRTYWAWSHLQHKREWRSTVHPVLSGVSLAFSWTVMMMSDKNESRGV